MRFAVVLPALLLMILPRAIGVAMAADPAWRMLSSSHPAWLRIESPLLIMLGCVLLGLAGLGRKALRND